MPSERKRRPPGTVGRQVVAFTNAYEMSWNHPQGNSGYVYHYDVIVPQWDTGSREFKLGNKKGTELIMRLQTSIRPDIFNPQGAYDGKKNLFSFREYPLLSEEFRVPWEASSQRPKEVTIRVVFVRRIDIRTLDRLKEGVPESIRPESDAAVAVNMLNLFVQSAPRMTDPRIHNVKSFFTPHNKHTGDRIRPLELWRGHFQSVRVSFDRIIVNVDVTVGVILPRGPLEQICGEYLRVRNLRDLTKGNIGSLRLFLKNVKVNVDLPSHAGKRPKSIKDVIVDVGERRFDKGGEWISIADHFRKAHNYTIRPGSLGVKLGSDGIFPMSVCKTIQQLYKNRSSPEVVQEALKFSPSGPTERLHAIKAGWENLQYTQSTFLRGAGISINDQPLHIHGRILPSPQIRFGGNVNFTPERQGQWDVMKKTFIEPAKLSTWTVVDLAGCENSVLSTFVRDLHQTMEQRGMVLGPPHNIVRASAASNIPAVLEQVNSGSEQVQLILVILPESAAYPYRVVKRWGDITRGVRTQCIKWTRKLASDAQNRKANQYHNNLILKINAKLGGVNYVPSDAAMGYLTQQPTMIIGADVSHPAPGSLLPSAAALVASMDHRLSKYAASIRIQASRTEIIEDLADVFQIALKTFKKRNDILPQRIFVFRDGVSEGEFNIVLDRELAAMKSTFAQAYGGDTRLWPQLTFIVVGKRHHFRFFPGDAQSLDSRGNGNMRAGFVVDQDIVHPVHADFYLQSQPGLKGTSRPSHYTVLRNGSDLNADQLQQISYALCHCYSRATRSVKIPAPVYYADLVCRRAKFHFSEAVNDIDSLSVSSDEQQQLHYYQGQFAAINDILKDTMYFV